MSDPNPVITPDDIRRAGHCADGFREWLAAHNLDLATFFRGGYRASDFLATNDANGIKVVELKMGTNNG